MKTFEFRITFNVALLVLNISTSAVAGQLERDVAFGKRQIYEIDSTFEESCQEFPSTENTIKFLENLHSCFNNVDGLNQTDLATQIQEAMRDGHVNNVFQQVCLKRSQVQDCMTNEFRRMGSCWSNNDARLLLLRAVGAAGRFYCGDSNDAARATSFVENGGLQCVYTHRKEIRTCFSTTFAVLTEFPSGCMIMNYMQKCFSSLRKCSDSFPLRSTQGVLSDMRRAIGCRHRHRGPAIVRHIQKDSWASRTR